MLQSTAAADSKDPMTMQLDLLQNITRYTSSNEVDKLIMQFKQLSDWNL